MQGPSHTNQSPCFQEIGELSPVAPVLSRARIGILFFSLVCAFLPSIALGQVNSGNAVLSITSPNWDGIQEEFGRAFSEWHKNKYGQAVDVQWRSVGGGASTIVKWIKTEYESKSSCGVDIFFGGGADPFEDLKVNHLLSQCELPSDILAAIPPKLNDQNLYDPDHYWYGSALSDFGIVCNERVKKVTNLPDVKTWEDLADPRLSTWIAASDPRASASALAVYQTIIKSQGWDAGWRIIAKMSGNARAFYTSGAGGAVEAGFGDNAYGLSVDIYGLAQSSYYGSFHDSPNVTFVIPEGESAITPDPIAILKNPPHPDIAQHFMEFVLGREGQLLWMLRKGKPGGAIHFDINRMSVYPSLYTELGDTSPVTTNPFTLPPVVFLYKSPPPALLSALLGAWVIDTHTEAAAAWRALNAISDLQKKAALQDEFSEPPLTEQEITNLPIKDWKKPDSQILIQLIIAWEGKALKRYRQILKEAAN